MKKVVSILLGSMIVTACSSPYSSTGENLYLKARNGNMPVVPPPLSTSNISSFYVLSEVSQNPVVDIRPMIQKN